MPPIVGYELFRGAVCEMCEYSVCGISTRAGAAAKSSYVSTIFFSISIAKVGPFPSHKVANNVGVWNT